MPSPFGSHPDFVKGKRTPISQVISADFLQGVKEGIERCYRMNIGSFGTEGFNLPEYEPSTPPLFARPIATSMNSTTGVASYTCQMISFESVGTTGTLSRDVAGGDLSTFTLVSPNPDIPVDGTAMIRLQPGLAAEQFVADYPQRDAVLAKVTEYDSGTGRIGFTEMYHAGNLTFAGRAGGIGGTTSLNYAIEPNAGLVTIGELGVVRRGYVPGGLRVKVTPTAPGDLDTASHNTQEIAIEHAGGGTFRLELEGYTTSALAYTVGAAALEAAIEALPNVVAATTGVSVTGSGTTVSPFVVEFDDYTGWSSFTANTTLTNNLQQWLWIKGGGSTSYTSITATTVNTTILNATTILTTIINGNTTTWTTGNIYNLDVIENFYASGNAYMMIQNTLVDWFPYLYATIDGNSGNGTYYGTQVEPDVLPAWWVPGPLEFNVLKEMNQNADVPTGKEVVIFAGDLLANTINVTVTRSGGGGTTTAVQTLMYQAASGLFGMSFAGETTANIAIGATAATLKSAVEALTAVTDTVTVTKSGQNYAIEFNNSGTTFYNTPMTAFFVGTPVQAQEFYFHWFTGSVNSGVLLYDILYWDTGTNEWVPSTLTAYLDLLFSTASRAILYRSDTAWTVLSGTTTGDLMAWDNTTLALVSPGAAGTVLTSNGVSSLPSFQ